MDTRDIYFKSEPKFSPELELGGGSEATVYRMSHGALKLFHFCVDETDKDLNKFRYFQQVDMTDFSFPWQLVFVNDRFSGYTMPLFDGKDLVETPYKRSFSLLKKAMVTGEIRAKNLANEKIQFFDLDLSNVIFLDRFKFIDIDSYSYDPNFSYQESFDKNIEQLNYLCDRIVISGLSIRNSHQLKLIRDDRHQFLEGKISSIEYLNKIQARLSDVAEKPITAFSQGTKVLQKKVGIER